MQGLPRRTPGFKTQSGGIWGPHDTLANPRIGSYSVERIVTYLDWTSKYKRAGYSHQERARSLCERSDLLSYGLHSRQVTTKAVEMARP